MHRGITCDSPQNGSFIMDDSLEYLDLSHLFNEEETENPLFVLSYQFSNGPENYIGWPLGVIAVT